MRIIRFRPLRYRLLAAKDLGEDCGGVAGLVVDDVRVDAKGNGGVGVAEAVNDEVDWPS